MNVADALAWLAHGLLALLWLAPAAACAYLLTLTLASRRLRAPEPATRELRFDIVVPAHDEAELIARTVRSLHALDWPRDGFRILVVADNCTDATASIARAAGAHVLERNDKRRRGKGHALDWVFGLSAEVGWADAVVVVDADTEVSRNLLEAFARRIERGAAAIQARYGVLNPMASWRTRLMTVAHACFHDVRSRARERLGCSCGVRGNGWCVTREALALLPYEAYSMTEDVEFGIRLGLAGVRVGYADEAFVLGEMAAGAQAASSQRLRWEGGRAGLRRTLAAPLLRQGLRQRSRVALDLAADLLVPPLATLALRVGALAALTAALTMVDGRLAAWLAAPALCGAALALYVLRGAQLSGLGVHAFTALAHAPGFMAWKLLLALRNAATPEWVRTPRELP